MSLLPILRYPLDLSGINVGNLVVGELHHLGALADNRAIAPMYGAFYTAGLRIRSAGGITDAIATTNVALTGVAPLTIGVISLGNDINVVKRVRLTDQTNPAENGFYEYTVSSGNYILSPATLGNYLVAGTEYVPIMLNQDATRESGKEVCQLIAITAQSLTDDIILEYQAVGGDFSVSSDALEQLITTLDLDNRSVEWGEIIGMPNNFPPSAHFHPASDYVGFGHVVDALERIRQIMEGGSGGAGSATNYRVYPAVTDQIAPFYTYIGWIAYQDYGGGDTTVSDVVFKCGGSRIGYDGLDVSEVYIRRVDGLGTERVLSGSLTTESFFTTYQDPVDFKIHVYLYNPENRGELVIGFNDSRFLTLHTTTPVVSPIPQIFFSAAFHDVFPASEALRAGGTFYDYPIPQDGIVETKDLNYLLYNSLTLFNSLADALELHVRPEFIESPI